MYTIIYNYHGYNNFMETPYISSVVIMYTYHVNVCLKTDVYDVHVETNLNVQLNKSEKS